MMTDSVNTKMEAPSFAEFLEKRPVINQEFWVFIASGIAIATFVLVWASIIITCKILLKLLKKSPEYDLEAFGAPIERQSALMIQTMR